MKSLILCAAAVVTFSAAPAAATVTYDGNFSALGTQGYVNNGWYFFTGHEASQTFTSTGLSSITSLDLVLNVATYGVSQPLTLTFSVNDTAVGSTTFAPGGTPGPRVLDFDFASIVGGGAGSDYTLRAAVTGPVCQGCGSIRLLPESPFTLSVGAAAVPEPGTWAMMLIGFGATGFALRRRRPSAVATA